MAARRRAAAKPADVSVDPGDAPANVSLPKAGEGVADADHDANLRRSVEGLAVAGTHRGTVSQVVDEVYASLQGQRVTALTSDDPDPFPLLAA